MRPWGMVPNKRSERADGRDYGPSQKRLFESRRLWHLGSGQDDDSMALGSGDWGQSGAVGGIDPSVAATR